MKNIAIILLTICVWSNKISAQDISINVLQIPASITAGGSGQIQVDICNNAPVPNTALPTYKLVTTITVSSFVQITGTTDLPAGWVVCAMSPQSITLSNASDAALISDQCRTFFIDMKAGATSNPGSEVTGTITFAGGTDETKCTGGAEPPEGDLEENNTATSSIVVVGALPVTLTRFDVQKEAQLAYLTWATATETNSDFFEVQRSSDSKVWKPIGQIRSAGESRAQSPYRFIDENPDKGINYYRLRMVDLDGSFAYSSIRSIEFESQTLSGVYPNPASNTMSINAVDWESVEKLEIIRTDGLTVYSSGKKPAKSVDVQNLSSGIYILKLIRKDGSMERLKAVIAR